MTLHLNTCGSIMDLYRLSSTSTSDASDLHSNVIYPNEYVTLDTIHDLLTQKLKLAQDKIDVCHVIESNNVETANEKITDREFIKAKTTFIKALNDQVKNLEQRGYAQEEDSAVVDFMTNLTKEVEDLKVLQEVKKIQLSCTEKSILNLQKEIDTLKQIMKSREEKGEMKEEADLEVVHEDVRRKFMQIKKYFNQVLDLSFPGDKVMHTVLEKLWITFFEGHDGQFVKFESKWHPYIELLVAAGIAIAHPHDTEKFKLATYI